MNKSVVQLRERHSNRSGFCSGRAHAVHLRAAGTAKTHATVILHAELRPLWSNNSLANSEVTCLEWLVQYLIHNSKSVNGDLSQNNPLHTRTFQPYAIQPISSVKTFSSLRTIRLPNFCSSATRSPITAMNSAHLGKGNINDDKIRRFYHPPFLNSDSPSAGRSGFEP
jgi:hypothetical protein